MHTHIGRTFCSDSLRAAALEYSSSTTDRSNNVTTRGWWWWCLCIENWQLEKLQPVRRQREWKMSKQLVSERAGQMSTAFLSSSTLLSKLSFKCTHSLTHLTIDLLGRATTHTHTHTLLLVCQTEKSPPRLFRLEWLKDSRQQSCQTEFDGLIRRQSDDDHDEHWWHCHLVLHSFSATSVSL